MLSYLLISCLSPSTLPIVIGTYHIIVAFIFISYKKCDVIKPQNGDARLLKILFPSENSSSYHYLIFNAWVSNAMLMGLQPHKKQTQIIYSNNP